MYRLIYSSCFFINFLVIDPVKPFKKTKAIITGTEFQGEKNTFQIQYVIVLSNINGLFCAPIS